ncbi:MAG TPA: methyltransferase domain-containing protein [Chloroflexota bacterium]|nr:methyltransferase domain-containing protein [Chloroflexota bacterium]
MTVSSDQGSSPATLTQAEAATILTRYRDEIVSPGNVYGRGLVRTWRRLFPQWMRTPIRCAITDAMGVRRQDRLEAIRQRRPLQLHLGSGDRYKEGWVNVDLVGHRVDLPWNLNRPLPLETGTVDAVFHEHVLEHLTLERGLALLEECHRVLRPGGTLRIGVPDAEAYVRSYCSDPNGFLTAMRPGRPTPLLALQEEFYWHGHRTMYDFETLSLVGVAAGFGRFKRCAFGESGLDPAPDSAGREGDTLYVETVR